MQGNDEPGDQAAKRECWALEKTMQRIQQKEYLSKGLKILICSLVLLETPWDIIGAIAACKLGRDLKTHSANPWTAEKIKQVAKEGLALQPDLVNDPLNDELVLVFAAKKWVAECKMTLWILEQNVKGVTMPASMVVQKYVSLWGNGPQKPRVDTHLAMLTNKHSRRNWLQRMRWKWNLQIGKLPHRASLSPEETSNKAINDN